MLYLPGEPETQHIYWHTLYREWVRPGLTLVLALVLLNFFLPRYQVDGQSMQPTLHDWERVWATNVNLSAITGEIVRGDLLIVTSPVGEVAAVKRAIGLPGETVRVFGGVVYIDDQPLDEAYLEERPRYTGEWTLGADEYFVLGDNRNHSTDSHSYGAIAASRIQGVVRLRFWPPGAWEWFTPPRYGE